MTVDKRPTLWLRTAQGRIKCGRPKVNPMSVGVQAGSGPLTSEQCTHIVSVYVALGKPPKDLKDDAVVTIDGKSYRVLKNGISYGAGVWKLYLKAERERRLA